MRAAIGWAAATATVLTAYTLLPLGLATAVMFAPAGHAAVAMRGPR